ncbi:MAG: hypothetical protein J5746_13890 [Victivallales bacterium]|nr:hypothetical protein [Victivallales bacterium]
MPCNCHTSRGLQVKVASPYDQCIACARKHIKNAWGAYNEFTYEDDNRDYTSDQLRKAADHLKSIRREIAIECRDMAMQLESNTDAPDMAARLDALRRRALELFYQENPEAAARLELMRSRPDVIIPLGSGSRVGNAELCLLLRSIDRHLKNYGRIFIATDSPPEWLDTDAVTVVNVPDSHTDNKDANLHDKILTVIAEHDVSDFVFCADDNCFMQDIAAGAIPILRNGKARASFYGEGLNRWKTRMHNTFEWAETQGASLKFHYDCHAPQLFDGRQLAERLPAVDYSASPGLCIYTAWRVLTGTLEPAHKQDAFKLTLESAPGAGMTRATLESRLFLGYNDSAAEGGLLDLLFQIFPDPSPFERANEFSTSGGKSSEYDNYKENSIANKEN